MAAMVRATAFASSEGISFRGAKGDSDPHARKDAPVASSPTQDQRHSLSAMFGSLTWPLVLGLAATGGFYGLIFRGPLHHPLVMRYFAGHPINMIETALFFIGLAALVLKLFELVGEFSASGSVSLGDAPGNQPPAKAAEWLEIIRALPERARDSHLGRRLSEALETVQRAGSADKLPDELKYLSEMAGGRAQDSYSLVRIVIWATPMLGFLGTVVGITDALGDLGRELSTTSGADAGGSLNTAMQGLLAGLYVAFDTTAIALCFSIALMFVQFMLDRGESQLLEQIDQQASRELAGRFETTGASSDPNVQLMQRLSQGVLKTTEQLVERQAQLWQQSIGAAHEQWQRTSRQTTEQMQTALTAALSQSLTQLAAQLAKSEQVYSEQCSARWEQWQTALSQNARVLHAQQQEMVKQGEMMTQVIRASGEVVQLENALNANLAALAGSKNFEDTVMSLAAAIHLLTTRLGHSAESQPIELRTPQVRGRAA
jgi:biopolymer transport protein ExbB/TolQ